MTEPKFYLDEDTQSEALIHALRSRGASLLTTSEAGKSKQSDYEQLRFAASENRVLLTYNIADFVRLHTESLKQGESHGGIILIRQQKWGPGELARRIIRLLAQRPAGNMRGCIEFLSAN